MKNKILTFLVSSLASFTVVADESNVNIVAKNNADPVFIESCELFRKAKAEKDIDMLMSFVPLEFKSTQQRKERAISTLTKYVDNFQKYSNNPNYEVISMELSKSMKDGYAAVNIEAKYGKKSFISSKCVFENVGDEKWNIVLSSG